MGGENKILMSHCGLALCAVTVSELRKEARQGKKRRAAGWLASTAIPHDRRQLSVNAGFFGERGLSLSLAIHIKPHHDFVVLLMLTP